MTLLYFLTLFPLVPALGMLLARGDRARDAVGLIGSGIIMAVTVVVAVMFFGAGPQSFEVAPGASHVLSIISSAIDVILCAVILYSANIRARSPRCSAWCSWWVRSPSQP